ncbi:MAG: hypothetical protein DMG04_04585 [Acidobacteria bacterium]|nr:MAG: hypothetical protein DMG04_04585 [Acidobacteriota bacterium]
MLARGRRPVQIVHHRLRDRCDLRLRLRPRHARFEPPDDLVVPMQNASVRIALTANTGLLSISRMA